MREISKKTRKQRFDRWVTEGNVQFWLIMAIPFIWLIVFAYLPMGGLALAFKEYSPRAGIFNSPDVGFKWFVRFLGGPYSKDIILNTVRLGVYSLLVGFPLPIILAICLNEVSHVRFKKSVQMVTYAPYFISMVVMVGMMMRIFDLRSGVINRIITLFGGRPINFFGESGVFPHLYVWSGVWQGTGYSSIIYISALAGVSPELKEAAEVDGATRLQKIWHIDLPGISPTVVMMLIFNVGQMLNIGFEKAYLMGNPSNRRTAEIISTYLYEVGIKSGNYSYATAVGLFNSLISLALFLLVNKVSKKLADESVF
ncbi:MAG: ABC transporter permease subunit [Eubacteriales bacterium]|nr:ABC transporter permease subunit [Eubacteriales bacterium]